LLELSGNARSERSPSNVGEGNRKLAVTAIILGVSRAIFVVLRDSKLNMADVVEGGEMVNPGDSNIISDEISDVEVVD